MRLLICKTVLLVAIGSRLRMPSTITEGYEDDVGAVAVDDEEDSTKMQLMMMTMTVKMMMLT